MQILDVPEIRQTPVLMRNQCTSSNVSRNIVHFQVLPQHWECGGHVVALAAPIAVQALTGSVTSLDDADVTRNP